jgi:N-acetyl-anhydromuramyl-L-alanine amidase AmpD
MTYKKLSRVDYLVVHCSATPPRLNWTAKDIDRVHRQQGWLSIGYHFVIRRDGTVDIGRPETAQGSHARGVNDRSLGICLVGGVDDKGRADDNFTPEQFASLRALLRQLKAKHPAAKIIGHRDVPGTRKACPSFDVADWLARNPIN